MNVEFRIKWDPRADGRVPTNGEMVEAWIQWQCPDANQYRVRTLRINGPTGDDDVYVQTVRTDWAQVVNYFSGFGVVIPATPSCPGFG